MMNQIKKDPVFELCDVVREVAFAIHRYHGPGHLEKIYENALTNRLRKLGHKVESQKPMQVRDEDGTLLGDFFADLVVDDFLILELKAVRAIVSEHVAQLLGYMRSSSQEHGLLLNFGASRFFIKKFILSESLAEL
ncbi:GxxExxY protein [Prosthecobacter sp.]|uniref:GxxExxY protein n=1 Tax=Prosthecobacter sp. TaxID=1965333 RepID=UPI0025FF5EBC|nr:GxxExxY protein [Prosthecobacter sp.]